MLAICLVTCTVFLTFSTDEKKNYKHRCIYCLITKYGSIIVQSLIAMQKKTTVLTVKNDISCIWLAIYVGKYVIFNLDQLFF